MRISDKSVIVFCDRIFNLGRRGERQVTACRILTSRRRRTCATILVSRRIFHWYVAEQAAREICRFIFVRWTVDSSPAATLHADAHCTTTDHRSVGRAIVVSDGSQSVLCNNVCRRLLIALCWLLVCVQYFILFSFSRTVCKSYASN